MKKAFTKVIATMLVIALTITILPLQQAKALVATGDGSAANPYKISISSFGSDSFNYNVSSNGYAHFELTFETSGKIELSNKNDYNMYIDGGSAVPKLESTKCAKGSTMSVKIKGNKGAKGVLYTKFDKLGDSLEEWNSKENAKDISNGYDSMDQTFESTTGTVWYKFTLKKQSVITLEIKREFTYFDIYDDSGKTVIDHGNYPDTALMSFYSVKNMQNRQKENNIIYTLYKTGTYYLCIKDAWYDGKMKFSVRDYVSITGVNFEKGHNVVISTYDPRVTNVRYENKITGLNPKNTDGSLAYSKFDTNFLEDTTNSLVNTIKIIKPKKYGTGTIDYYDERGVKVDQVSVKVIPEKVKNVSFVGSTNKINVYVLDSYNQLNGDYVRVFQRKNGKWVKIAQIKKSSIKDGKPVMVVKKLKPNTNYEFRLSNYDSKSKMESRLSSTFKAGTATKGIPKIKKASKMKITKREDAIVHNPGKITEWHEPYLVYSSSSEITVSKVKGATGYAFSCGGSMKKTKGRIVVASTKTGMKGTKNCLPKKVKVKVQTYRRISKYAIAYGKYSKAKTIRVR